MAAVRLWGTLLTGMLSGGNKGPEDVQVYTTEFAMHRVSYYFMVWSSLTLGGIMLIEQYFGRRIFCFAPSNFTQSPIAIGEYCWQHGHFKDKYTKNLDYEMLLPENMVDETWILQSFVYFLIRGLVFIFPHIIWRLKYETWVIAAIKGTVGLVKELQLLWLQFSEVADKAYREHSEIHNNHNKTSTPVTSHNPWERAEHFNHPTRQPQNLSPEKIKAHKTYNAVMAMTRDVVQITKQQVPHYSGLLCFTYIRILYETTMLIFYGFLDFVMFLLSSRYDSTDYYCALPNEEVIRCMVPMVSFQWYASLIAMITTFTMLVATLIYAVSMFISLYSSSTKGTFLDHIPYSEVAGDTKWYSCTERKTYKLLSDFLMQNVAILHPLTFLESFVEHIKENHQAGHDILPASDWHYQDNSFQMRRLDHFGAGTDGIQTDEDDQLWRRLITQNPV